MGDEWENVRRASEGLSNVLLPGWLNLGGLQAYSKIAHIGICPTNHSTDILPNKAIVYLAAGLPVVSAFHGDLVGILEERNCGFTYQPGDIQGLCETLERLHSQPELCRQMSENARATFEDLFQPDSVYESYLDAVESLATAADSSKATDDPS